MSKVAGGRIGFVIGADTDRQLASRPDEQLTMGGASDLHRLRSKRPGDAILHISRNYFRQPRRYRWDAFDCLVNCVTDPDQNPKVLANIQRIVKTYDGRVINYPDKVLGTGRDAVARVLAEIPGAIVPTTLRFNGSPGRVAAVFAKSPPVWPAIVRVAGTHTGRILGVFKDIETLQPKLDPRTEYIATRYVSYRSPDELFRKFRIFFIGREMIFRHVIMSDNWNIHVRDRGRFMIHRPEIADEWRRWHERGVEGFAPEVRRSLELIRDRIGLDFFGIDFGLSRQGALVLFEANATMNFFPVADDPERPFLRSCLAPAQAAYDRMLLRAELSG